MISPHIYIESRSWPTNAQTSDSDSEDELCGQLGLQSLRGSADNCAAGRYVAILFEGHALYTYCCNFEDPLLHQSFQSKVCLPNVHLIISAASYNLRVHCTHGCAA